MRQGRVSTDITQLAEYAVTTVTYLSVATACEWGEGAELRRITTASRDYTYILNALPYLVSLPLYVTYIVTPQKAELCNELRLSVCPSVCLLTGLLKN